MDQYVTWHTGRPRPKTHCVVWGPSSLPQTAGWIKMPLGTEVNLGPGDVVLDGVAAPPKRGTAPQFLVHVCCGQTAGWMKTPLGTEVDLGPGHIVLDEVPALCERGIAAPSLRPMSINGHGRPSQLLLSSCSRCNASSNRAADIHALWLK